MSLEPSVTQVCIDERLLEDETKMVLKAMIYIYMYIYEMKKMFSIARDAILDAGLPPSLIPSSQ